MDQIILQSARLKCTPTDAFRMFTENKQLERWLPKKADVEPSVGGKYELFFDSEDRENNSTIGCRVTALVDNHLIAFEWKGPLHFKHFMNSSDPLTHVAVFFSPCDGETTTCTLVHVLHTGWRSSEEWEEARKFFEWAWRDALDTLKEVVAGK